MDSSTDPRMALRRKVVVVTGGNGGIGLGIARGVGLAGATVVLWARNVSKTSEAVEQLEQLGVTSFGVECDVSEEDAARRAIDETVDRAGAVDVLFANAGLAGRTAPFIDLSLSDWREVMSVDIDGTFLSLQAAARQMIHQGHGGSLIGVSSIIARFGGAQKAAYGTAKTAVEGLMRSLAVELAPSGIRCNSLAPGWTETDLTSAAGGNFGAADYDKFRSDTTRRTATRRWAVPDDFAAAAVFLADPALTFHTGTTLIVDGGYSIT